MMRQSDEQIEGARYPFHRIKGVWGFAPCLPRALALWRPNDRMANAAGMARAFYPRPDGLASSFWLRTRPASQIAGAVRHAFAARAFCARYPFHRIKGVWGFAPCLPRALALWRPNDRMANAAGMARAFYPRPDGLAGSLWFRTWPASQIAGAACHTFAARAFCSRYP